MIQEIFAEADYGVRVFEKTEELYDSYSINCYLKIYGIPDNLTDNDEENILGGEIDRAVLIGSVTGLLILGGQAEKHDMDIYDVCGCIDKIEMCGDFENGITNLRILDCLPKLPLRAYHSFPDIIADRPVPLP